MVNIIVETDELNILTENDPVQVQTEQIVLEINTINETIEIVDTIIPVKGEPGEPYSSQEFVFNIPDVEFVVSHNKNYYPSIIIKDANNKLVEGEVDYFDLNTVIVRFSIPFIGSIIVN